MYLGLALVSTLPIEALDRLDPEVIKGNYDPKRAARMLNLSGQE